MIGSKGFRKAHQRQTLTYSNERPLHQQRYPKLGKDVSPGLIINLSHTDTDNEVAATIAIEHIQDDRVLSLFLNECIKRYKDRRALKNPQKTKSRLDLVNSHLFKTLDRPAQERILTAVSRVGTGDHEKAK